MKLFPFALFSIALAIATGHGELGNSSSLIWLAAASVILSAILTLFTRYPVSGFAGLASLVYAFSQAGGNDPFHVLTIALCVAAILLATILDLTKERSIRNEN